VGNRTYFQLTVFACPPAAQAAVLAVLDDHGITVEFAGDEPPPGTVALQVTYHEEEAALDLAEVVGPKLAKLDVAFHCWTDPAYQDLGQFYAHTPELGPFEGLCSAYGDVLLNADEIAALVALAPDLPTLERTLDAATGGPWSRALGTLATAAPPASRDVPA
jgi:hypothetical protein